MANASIDCLDGELFEDEQAAIEQAMPKRAAEFRAGRILARQALGKLGCPPSPIPRGPDRRPLWPEGFLGSISHSDYLCAAAVAKTDQYLGLGLDLEPDIPLKPQLRRMICRPEEHEDLERPLALAGGPPLDRGKLIFVAKEAFFKAYYPQARFFLDFRHARIDIDEKQTTFVLEIVEPEAPRLTEHHAVGKWTWVAGHIAAAITLPHC